MTALRWLLLLISSIVCMGWTRPDRQAPVILIERLTGCQVYPWDTRPCESFNVQNGFAGWDKIMTIEEVNHLIETLDETTCHPDFYANPSNQGWM